MNKGRKITSGKYHANRKKKKYERKGQANKTSLGEDKRKTKRTKGGHKKTILLNANTVNVMVDKKVKKVGIKNVVETPQNNALIRQKRLIKGAIIETTLGKAKITNRPSREGCVNAILVKE